MIVCVYLTSNAFETFEVLQSTQTHSKKPLHNITLCELEHELCHFISQITMSSAPELQRSKAQKTGIQVVKYSGVWSCAEGTASEESGKASCVIELAIEGSIDSGPITQQKYFGGIKPIEWQKIQKCPYLSNRKSDLHAASREKKPRVNRTYSCWDMSIFVFSVVGWVWYEDRLKINQSEDCTSLCLVQNENFMHHINVFGAAHQPTVQGSCDHNQMTSFNYLKIR